MVKLKPVGVFKEIFPSEEGAPSMVAFLNAVPQQDEDRIVQYLRSGRTGAACGYPLRDAFNPNKWIGSMATMDDGVWYWPNVLAYYVENYHCRLPEEFVAHMRSMNWRPPT